MREVLESLAEIHSTTPHNRWNKDAQLLNMWNSLHGVWQYRRRRLRGKFHDAKRLDFVPSYVMRKLGVRSDCLLFTLRCCR